MAALVTPAAALVSELMAQGRKSAAALEALVQVQDHAGMRNLTAEILRCCDRALIALNGKPGRHKRKTGTSNGETAAAARVERKRNWDDGFMWTNYGQKGIRGSNHPRHYFRCAYADAGGCPARRQVQQSEEHDPPLYVLTYFGDHTCCLHGHVDAVLEDLKTIQLSLVVDFGSASAGSRSPRPDEGDVCSGNTSRSESEELGAVVAKVESPDLRPAGPVAELSSSADDVRCSSSGLAAWDPSAAVCANWDYFGNCSFDHFSEFFDFEDIAMYG